MEIALIITIISQMEYCINYDIESENIELQ